MKALSLLPLLLIITLLSACSLGPSKNELLNVTLKSYEKSIRWGDYDRALSMHRLKSFDQKQVPYGAANTSGAIKVTKYQVVRNPVILSDGDSAEQVIAIDYYNRNSMVSQHQVLKQEFSFDQTHQRWFLTTPPPTFVMNH